MNFEFQFFSSWLLGVSKSDESLRITYCEISIQFICEINIYFNYNRDIKDKSVQLNSCFSVLKFKV